MRFEDVIGQSRSKAFLLSLARSERVPHALLLLGPTGAGSLALALAMAQRLQCEQPAPGGDACGECGACRKAGALAHPDIHYAYPTVGANAVSTDFLKEWRAAVTENPYFDAYSWLQRLSAENKQGNITRAECQAIQKKLSLKTFEGRYKILVLWLPEYLEKEGNRLLKLIEEPPEDTVFLLVAEDAEAILPTILSRCQLVRTGLLSDAEVAGALRRDREFDEERARQLAFLAGGNYHNALELADHPAHNNTALLLDWLRKCYRGNGVDLVKWTEEFAKLGRENQKQFLLYGLHFLRELLSLIVTADTHLRLGAEEYNTAVNLAKMLNFEKITVLTQLLNDNIYYIERNANPKILFLDTSIQIHQVFRGS